MLTAWGMASSERAEPSRGTTTVLRDEPGEAGPVTVARTMSMGLGTVCNTLSVTLPMTHREMPPRPWVHMTTSAPGSVPAWATITSAAGPRWGGDVDGESGGFQSLADWLQGGFGSLPRARLQLVRDAGRARAEDAAGKDIVSLDELKRNRQAGGHQLGVGQGLFRQVGSVQWNDYFRVHAVFVLPGLGYHGRISALSTSDAKIKCTTGGEPQAHRGTASRFTPIRSSGNKFFTCERLRRGDLTGAVQVQYKDNLDFEVCSMSYKAEYIWIDGQQPTAKLRSKAKIVPDGEDPPIWGFDGSSTNQAPGENSDCVLSPVLMVPDPIRGGNHKLVMCEVLLTDMTPHPSNTPGGLRRRGRAVRLDGLLVRHRAGVHLL